MRTIAIPLFEGYQPLDITGPHEVFVGANDAMDTLGVDAERYAVSLVAESLDNVISESGMGISPNSTFASATTFDTLVVPGGRSTRDFSQHGKVLEWMQACGPKTRRVSSVCTGTFLLAEAGLVTNERVTTHWALSLIHI